MEDSQKDLTKAAWSVGSHNESRDFQSSARPRFSFRHRHPFLPSPPGTFPVACLQLASLKSPLVSVLGCLTLLTAVAWGQSQTSYRIDTFAGLTGVGDGLSAIAAPLRFPTDIAVGAAGNLYIADRSNHRIRKVDSTGTITTIAGTGTGGFGGFGGDGGPATEAQLSSPRGVAVDGAGDLYIADTSNHRIRKVTTRPVPPPTPPSGGGGGGGPRTSAPGSPRNLTAVGGGGQVVLTWDAPEDDGGAAITDYQYRINGRNPWISIGSTDTTHTVTGLVNDTAYVFLGALGFDQA